MSTRSAALAVRLEAGANALMNLAASLTDAEWQSRLPKDGRKIGVVVHHVAGVYPIEIELALKLGAGRPISGVVFDDIHAMNAQHALDHGNVTKEEAIALLKTNSAAAADAVRALTDEQLDNAAPVSLYGDAPLTCQFFLEDHAVRHSYHHTARIRAVLAPNRKAA